MPQQPAPEAWARDLRLARAADARSRRAHWDQSTAEEATLASTIEGLARAGLGVRLDLGPAGTHRGSLVELGPDHVRLADPDRWCYLRLSSVEVVTASGDHRGAAPVRVERTFVEALSRDTGEEVVLVLASGAQRAGRVAAVGVDVVTLSGAPPAEPAYVSSSAVVAVLGVGSG